MLLQLDGLPTKAIGLRARIDPSPTIPKDDSRVALHEGSYVCINKQLYDVRALHGIRGKS